MGAWPTRVQHVTWGTEWNCAVWHATFTSLSLQRFSFQFPCEWESRRKNKTKSIVYIFMYKPNSRKQILRQMDAMFEGKGRGIRAMNAATSDN